MNMGIYAMTGGATGIGAELKRQLLDRGHQVISVDIVEGDIIADLSTVEGRQAVALHSVLGHTLADPNSRVTLWILRE